MKPESSQSTVLELLMSTSKGQVLIELIIGFGIATIVLSSIVLLLIGAREAKERSANILSAETASIFQAEALRSVREGGWNNLQNGTYHIEKSGTSWSLISGSQTGCEHCAAIIIADACRQNNVLADCPTGTVDPSTKKITVSVTWELFFGGGVEKTFYLTRYLANTTWNQTTMVDFNAGTTTNTVVTNNNGGEVQLAPSAGGNWNNPQVIATRDLSGTADANDVFVDNNRAYIVTLTRTGADFFIYDITTPNNPSLLGSLDLASNGYGVVVSGNYAYVATSHDTRELTIINVSNPSAPTITGSFNAPTTTDGRGVAVSGSTAYLITNDNTTAPGYEFYSIDVSNPTAPSQIGGLNLGSAARDVFVSGSYAYIASTANNQELQVIDITEPATPTLAGSFNSPGSSDGTSVYVVGNTAYITDARLNILNVTNPASVSLIGFYNAPGTPYGVFVSGNFAFLGHSRAGSQFKVIDITNPSSPIQFGSANLGGSGFGVFVVGDYAYLATASDTAEFQVIQGGLGAFQTAGTFESATFDATNIAGFNFLTWTATEPAGTNVQFQVATNNDAATWTFVGPDGTGATFYEVPAAIPLSAVSGRYFRFQAFLSGNGSVTPILEDLTINYSP